MLISYSFKDSLINQIKIYFLRKQKTKKETQKFRDICNRFVSIGFCIKCPIRHGVKSLQIERVHLCM